VNPLTLTIVLYLFKSLHQYHISKLSSTSFLLLSISLFVIYTVNIPVVRPRSCRVIYYFDTPTLGRRHQLFDRVTYQQPITLSFSHFLIFYVFLITPINIVVFCPTIVIIPFFIFELLLFKSRTVTI
jgi:hypothetical protein